MPELGLSETVCGKGFCQSLAGPRAPGNRFSLSSNTCCIVALWLGLQERG